MLTRTQAPTTLRAALLETAFVEDGLPEYADAIHGRLGLDLPWRTLWSVSVPGISAVAVGSLPRPEGPADPVAVLGVPAGTLVHALAGPDDLGDIDPGQVLRLTEEERAAAPLGLNRGADHVRVWDRATEDIVAALVSDTPVIAAALSPDGILVVATERGAKALRIPGRPLGRARSV